MHFPYLPFRGLANDAVSAITNTIIPSFSNAFPLSVSWIAFHISSFRIGSKRSLLKDNTSSSIFICEISSSIRVFLSLHSFCFRLYRPFNALKFFQDSAVFFPPSSIIAHAESGECPFYSLFFLLTCTNKSIYLFLTLRLSTIFFSSSTASSPLLCNLIPSFVLYSARWSSFLMVLLKCA